MIGRAGIVRNFLLSTLLLTSPTSTCACFAQSAQAPASLETMEQEVAKLKEKGNVAALADGLYDLARAYFGTGNFEHAERLMQEALTAETKLGRPPSRLRTLVALGSIYAQEGKIDDAKATYQQARQFAASSKLSQDEATMLCDLASLCVLQKSYDEALSNLESARKIYSSIDDQADFVSSSITEASIYRELKKFAEAEKVLAQVKETAVKSQDPALIGSLLLEQGRCACDQGNFKDALAHFEHAKTCYESAGDSLAEARVLNASGAIRLACHDAAMAKVDLNQAKSLLDAESPSVVKVDTLIALGAACADLGDMERAESLHKEAQTMADQLKDQNRKVRALSELGFDYFIQSSPEKALEVFLLALEAEQKINADLSTTYRDLGMCYRALGQTEQAIRCFEEAAKRFQAQRNVIDQAMALNSIAVSYLDSGASQRFQEYFDQAHKLVEVSSNQTTKAYLDYNYAQFLLVQGKYQDAVANYTSALKVYKAVGDTRGENQVLRGLGLVSLKLDQPDQAKQYYGEALSQAESMGNLEAKWDCLLGLGKACRVLKDNSLAIKYLTQACDIVEKERAQLTRDSSKTFDLDLRQDCFLELIDLLVDDNKPGEALVVAERGRARAFQDLLQGRVRNVQQDVAQSAAPEKQPDGIGSKTASPNAAAVALSNSSPRAKFVGGAGTSRGVDILPRSTQDVDPAVISQTCVKPPNLEEIKELVRASKSTFVEYAVLPRRLVIWVIHQDGSIEMPPPVPVTRKVLTAQVKDAALSVVAAPKSINELHDLEERQTAQLTSMHKLLIDPIVLMLPKSADEIVTIVPHGPLFSVPFAALLDKNKKFLTERYTLNYQPAIQVVEATRAIALRNKGSEELVAFGNPVNKAVPMLGALPYAEKEVKDIAQLFGAQRSMVEIGAQANKSTFIKLSPQGSVVHLATHGLVDEQRPLNSALLLAPEGSDDGLFTVSDILRMPQLRAKLVVLSACQTAKGKITGDGVVGLSRAFIAAGTPSIIVSQWNVDDVMTAFQMSALYKSYLSGASKAHSLREAQLKTINFMESGKTPSGNRANARYWAAFQLVGEAN